MYQRSISTRQRIAAVCALASMAAIASPSFGVTRTWDGQANDGNWFTPANWSGDIAPVAADTALITNGQTVTVAGSATPSVILQISGGSALTISTGGTVNLEAVSSNRIGSSGVGTLNLSGGALTASTNLSLAYGLASNATVNHTAGTLSIGNQFLLGTGGAANTGGSSTYYLTGAAGDKTVQGSGSITVTGTMTLGHQAGDGVSVSPVNRMYINTSGVVTAGGVWTVGYSNNAATPSTTSVELLRGTVNANGTTTDGSISVGNAGSATWTQSGGAVNAAGHVTVGRTGGQGTWNQSGGSLTIASGGTLRFSGTDPAITSVLDLSGGSITTPILNQGNLGSSTVKLRNTGVLTVDNWAMNNGTDIQEFTGGTLHTTGNGTSGSAGRSIQFSIANNGTRLAPGAAGQIGLLAITSSTTNNNNLLGGTGSDLVHNSGVIEIQLAGDNSSTANYDRITVSDVAEFGGGSIAVSLLNSFAPTTGNTWDIIKAGGSINASAITNLTVSTPGYFLTLEDSSKTLRLHYDASLVPEPATIGLCLLGLPLMLWGRKRQVQ